MQSYKYLQLPPSAGGDTSSLALYTGSWGRRKESLVLPVWAWQPWASHWVENQASVWAPHMQEVKQRSPKLLNLSNKLSTIMVGHSVSPCQEQLSGAWAFVSIIVSLRLRKQSSGMEYQFTILATFSEEHDCLSLSSQRTKLFTTVSVVFAM